jgi:hypothetical protein
MPAIVVDGQGRVLGANNRDETISLVYILGAPSIINVGMRRWPWPNVNLRLDAVKAALGPILRVDSLAR